MLTMRWIATLGLILGSTALLSAKPPVPRPTPEFTVTMPSGAMVPLTSYRGKVVLLQFLYTTCPHCQVTAQFFTKLQQEMGPRGLQVVGIAFNEEAEGHPEVVRNFVEQFNLGFPIGLAPRDKVLNYLGISIMERFAVPQIVVIDRNGQIRLQSDVLGGGENIDELHLGPFIDGLLKETKRPGTVHKPLPTGTK